MSRSCRAGWKRGADKEIHGLSLNHSPLSDCNVWKRTHLESQREVVQPTARLAFSETEQPNEMLDGDI